MAVISLILFVCSFEFLDILGLHNCGGGGIKGPMLNCRWSFSFYQNYNQTMGVKWMLASQMNCCSPHAKNEGNNSKRA